MSVKIKAAVRARDEHRCVKCGMTNEEHVSKYGKALDVHRVEPGSEYTIPGCITVCRYCHGPLPRTLTTDQIRRLTVPYTVLHVQVPSELKMQFVVMAKANGRTFTAELVRAMESHVQRWEKRRAEGEEDE